MEPYSAWHALIHSETFIWYLLIAVFSLGLAISKFINGFDELRGQDKDELTAYVVKANQQCNQTENTSFARWKVDLQTIILELKHDKNWGLNKQGEALMVAAVLKALSYIKMIELNSDELTTLPALFDWFKNHDSFKEVSGKIAQQIANRNQLAFAICLAKNDEQTNTAALVIPGQLYPGTPFGNDNPMILWFGQDSVMELQAAVAFSEKNKPSYFVVKNVEC